MWKKLLTLLAVVMLSGVAACGGGPEEKAYGFWRNTEIDVNYLGQRTTYITAFELTKDTYKSSLTSSSDRHRETLIYYETSGEQIIVRDLASKEAVLILRDITEDNMTVLENKKPVDYWRSTLEEIEEDRRAIEENSRR